MDVKISGRHGEYSDDVKDYIVAKMEPLSRFNRHAQSIEVLLDEDQQGHTVEVIAHLDRGERQVVSARHPETMAAVDLAHDKIERLLRRLKEKAEDRRHPPRATGLPLAGAPDPTDDIDENPEA